MKRPDIYFLVHSTLGEDDTILTGYMLSKSEARKKAEKFAEEMLDSYIGEENGFVKWKFSEDYPPLFSEGVFIRTLEEER